MKCAFHPELEAVVRCLRCQSTICRDCSREIGDRLLCVRCVADLAAVALASEGDAPPDIEAAPTPAPETQAEEALAPAPAKKGSRKNAPPAAEKAAAPEVPQIITISRTPAEFVARCDEQFTRFLGGLRHPWSETR